MAKLPYGGVDFSGEYNNDLPWTRLATIAEYLEAGEPLPCFLAEWLGQAITRSKQDANELLYHLGLAKKQGRAHTHSQDAWLVWGGRVYDLINTDGVSKERAIAQVLQESGNADELGEPFSRSTLQRWFDLYSTAKEDYDRICQEEVGLFEVPIIK